MKAITEFPKVYIKLFLPFLFMMLGLGHSISGFRHAISRTPILFFGFSYTPTTLTFAATLIITIVALAIAIKMLLNIRRYHTTKI
jgi:succinate dehydrogenase/fumarate reductase cytochrome b subunit